jgi:SAM-dependent methyltransferase
MRQVCGCGKKTSIIYYGDHICDTCLSKYYYGELPMSDYKQGYMDMVNERDNYYKRFRVGRTFKDTKKWLAEKIPVGAKVLDYGCGNGTLGGIGHIIVNGKPLDVIGFDIDQKNLLAKYHVHEDVKEYFDVIIMSHVVEHMTCDNVRETIKWASEHANRVLIVTPNAELNPFVNFSSDSTHIRPLNIGELPYWCAKNGFENVEVIWSLLPLNLKWYQILYRIYFAKMAGVSPFQEYCVNAAKAK